MFRYRLRTLLILLAVGPPLLAGAWWVASRMAEPPPLTHYGGGATPAELPHFGLVPDDYLPPEVPSQLP